MKAQQPTSRDRVLAGVCLKCPVCRRARRRQRGAAFWLVRNLEGHVCPFCRAYERVFGRKAHEGDVRELKRPTEPSGSPISL